MSALVSASLNLSKVPKDKIIEGKKGKYINVTVSINDETDDYGNNAAIYVEQSKEEREAKKDRTYLGNGRVVWNDGTIKNYSNGQQATVEVEDVDDELPF